MSQALYRKYRSAALDDIVGQSHITDLLKRSLKAGRISHAYLFTGPRGVGKTSIARILAHEINGLPYSDTERHLDIIEIDAASNNGVEDVRDLREKVRIAPVSAKKKVYIIDEVHMLSKAAFNALLKTLEEPPEHIVFILATTDVEKLPATIISRTQRFAFRAIAENDALSHLKHIAEEEGITVDDEALALIAERGDGSFRDSISLLDQLSSLADEKQGITAELVEVSLGLAPKKLVEDILETIRKHDIAALASLLSRAESDGISATVLTDQLIRTLRQMSVEKPQALSLLDALLDVSKSSHPSMKLFSVLGSFAAEAKPKTAALTAPVMEVSASIASLSKEATAKKPSEARVAKSAKVEPSANTQVLRATEASKEPFNWAALLEYIKEHSMAVYSVISKTTPEVVDGTLNIYAVNAFYKKKLDDPKYHAHLYEGLHATGGYNLTIETIPTRAPLKDSQAAAIADIMGGGEEVSVETA